MGTQRALLATAALAMLCLVVSSNSASDGSCSAADPGSCVGVRVPYKGISMLQHRGALQKVEAHHLKVKSAKVIGDYKAEPTSTNPCPSSITSLEECKLAAQSLGITVKSESTEFSNHKPGGCSYFEESPNGKIQVHLRFN